MAASRAHNYLAAMLNTASTWLATQTIEKAALAATPTDALVLSNSTAALVGAQVQMMPRLRLRGAAWDTDNNVSRVVDWTIDGLPAAAAVVTSTLKFSHSLAGAAYTVPMTLTSAGALTLLGAVTAASLYVQDSAADHTIQFKTASDEAGDRILTIPALGGNHTLAAVGLDNAFSVAQTFIASGIKLKDATTGNAHILAIANNGASGAQTFTLPAPGAAGKTIAVTGLDNSFSVSQTTAGLTSSATVIPSAANQAGIGSTSAEWLNAYLGESTAAVSGSGLYLGLSQQWRLWTNSAQHASEATCPANALVLNEGTVPALCILGSAISGFTAAADVDGNAILLGTQAGGTATAAGKAGAAFTLTTGAGSAGVGATTSGAGGALGLTAGAGATSSGATGTGGAGGSITLTPGAGGAANGGIAGARGQIRLASAATTADPLADVLIGCSATTQKGLVIQGLNGQSANLIDVQTSAGASVLNVSPTGAIGALSVSVSGSVQATGNFWQKDDTAALGYFFGSAADAALVRSAAGVVKVTNGSTGYGSAIAKTFSNGAAQSTTLGVAATTLAVTIDLIVLTGDAGGNTIATITGGVVGQRITLLFVDALVTITDDATGNANTVNLSGAFTSTANDTLTLVSNGTSWFEVARSVN